MVITNLDFQEYSYDFEGIMLIEAYNIVKTIYNINKPNYYHYITTLH